MIGVQNGRIQNYVRASIQGNIGTIRPFRRDLQRVLPQDWCYYQSEFVIKDNILNRYRAISWAGSKLRA